MSGNIMKKVIAPKGYFFKVTRSGPYYVYISLFEKGKDSEIGHVNLHREYAGCFSTHSYLLPGYRNKGFGALMYAKAIQWGKTHGYRVKSSGGSSSEAQRVWRGGSLRRWFDIRVRSHETQNPNYDTFYPQFKKGERPVTKKKRK
jgi:GNAT superfamily N-acetyltransferase